MSSFILTVIILSLSTVPAFAKKTRYLTCPHKYPKSIRVPFNDVMTLEFPEKPRDSLPGNNRFDFKFIGNDLAIKSLSLRARANLFVYLGKRKCVFKLITTRKNSDDVVIVRYPKEKVIEVKYVK